jgi:valyl-tRNA synthetase
MSHELPKAYDPALIEDKWARYWVEEHLFDVPSPTAGTTHKPFVQLLPPPNVTGRLHMGHMLNQTEMDILTRWHRMSGDTAVWVPGTDHAGIATQMMVERQLAAAGQKRTDFTREAFTEKVWAWKQQYGSAITEQMKRLGASVDWSREYFTMDDRLSVAVREAFVRLYEQGLIYRGAYIVNWDPQLQSAVSDLEVESEERPGHLFYIRYDLADGTGSITIATTRPETLLGDTAVVVNPTDARYTHLIGKTLILPLSAADGQPAREIPILADDWAQPEFGTGAVKVTPAHDPNDFAIGQRHHLPSLNIMDTQARIALVGSPYNGLDRFEARKRMVADLEAAGHLVKIADHTLTLPISQRTGVIIEPRLSMQWFLAVNKTPDIPNTSSNLSSRPEAERSADGAERPASPGPTRNSIAANAIAAVREGHITFTPEMYTKTYNEWMTNIHDWCISRQLWWGHRIPAWHCNACGAITVSRDPATACSGCGITDIHQETDVLDTWFSSGLLPFTVFGWDGSGELTPDLAAFYPTQLLVTGFDILFFWVARMIMLGTHFMLDVPMPDGGPRTLADAVPFREVYIHALVRDADRQKMSKTKGNVLDPIEIVSKYGTDAVRFTLASQASPGTDIAFNEARTEGYRAFCNKIWNAARFLQMNIDRAAESGISIDLSTLKNALKDGSDNYIESRWIRSQLSRTAALVNTSLSEYRFDEAANHVYQFFWGDFCDWYLEAVKLRLDFAGKPDVPSRTEALRKFLAVYESALRLLSPFMPFLTEELWHAFYAENIPFKSIALANFPVAEDALYDETDVAHMNFLQELITTVRSLRKDMAIPEKEFAPIQVFTGSNFSTLLETNADMLAKLCRVSAVELSPTPLTGDNTRSTTTFDVAVLYARQIDVPAERERLSKDLAKYNKGLESAEKQLNNAGFIARAPAAIVEGLKKQHAETLALKQKTEAALAALPNP